MRSPKDDLRQAERHCSVGMPLGSRYNTNAWAESSTKCVSNMGLSVAQVTALIDEHFPQARDDIGAFMIETVDARATRLRLPIRDSFIRPGGSVSGPTMFKLADLSVYAAILGQRGTDALQAVTSSMTINFLARPEPRDLICEVALLRLGRRLAVAEARLWSEGASELVGHATCTYALPSRRTKGRDGA